MKKYNLKRFLASLLAVLMLASVTGVSPAVFAEDVGSAPLSQEETVKPVLKDKTDAAVEVIIKGDTDVKDALAKALLANYAELTKEQIAAIDWQYECEGYRKSDSGHVNPSDPKWGSINGFKSDGGIFSDYIHAALANQKNDKTFKVCIGSDTANYREITKVDKYSTTLVLNQGVSVPYNMSAAELEKSIINSVIDKNSSTLPADVTSENFTVCKLLNLGLFWAENSLADKSGRPTVDAGDTPTIRVKYKGNDTYKECSADVQITIVKATVKVSVTPITTIYAGEEIDRSTFYTLNPNDPELDVYIFFVGVNSNKETCVNIKLSEDQEKLINSISDAQIKYLKYNESDTIRGKLNNGITFGELKDIINGIVTNKAIMGALELLGYDTEAIKNIVTALDKLTSLSDDTVIAIGTPAHAGVYVATAVAVGKNYETGTGTGSLVVLKNWKGIKLEKNPVLNSGDKANTITVSQADALKDGNDLCILTKDGEALNSASAGSIHYWFTGVGKIYAKSTMPTAPGKYIVTASVRGGDFFAFPKTFVFTIVADPTPEVNPET